MANDVLSDEQIANLIDAYGSPHEWADKEVAVALRELQHRRAQENSSLPGTLAAVQAQPFCRLCVGQGRIYVGTEWRLCSCQPQPVSAGPEVDLPALANRIVSCVEDESAPEHFDQRVAVVLDLLQRAPVSHLRDETREPDTAGRVERGSEPIWTSCPHGCHPMGCIQCQFEARAAEAAAACEALEQLAEDVSWELCHYAGLTKTFGQVPPDMTLHALAKPRILAALQRARESAQGKTR
jgi:hypothetical protein